ncbi:MAG: hypothetical protein ACKOWH_01910 [Rhodoluna sp.]
MRIQDLFEDLEAQFDAAKSEIKKPSNLENVRAIQIKTTSLVPRELIAPILGLDFVAGLDPIAPVWHIYPNTSIKSVELGKDQNSDLPLVRTFAVDLSKFIEGLPRPCSIRWRTKGVDEYLQSGQFNDIAVNLMLVNTKASQNPMLIPFDSLYQLSVESVDNFGGSF